MVDIANRLITQRNCFLKIMSDRLVFGVAINDVDYRCKEQITIGWRDGKQVQKTIWICPAYRNWRNMLNRCYSPKFQVNHQTYIGCSVSEEWLSLSTFKKWHDENFSEGLHLDKDVIIEDNKIYSAKTCAYVPRYINALLTDHRGARGEWPLGVSWNARDKRFMSQCSFGEGKSRPLGSFHDPMEAHFAWICAKIKRTKEVVEMYHRENNVDIRVVDALNKFIERLNGHLVSGTEVKTT